MTDFFDELEAQLLDRVDDLYPAVSTGRTGAARVIRDRARRSDAVRAARVRAWAVIGAAVGATVAGLLMLISAAPATTSLDVTRTSRGLLSIAADGPLGMVALNERLLAMSVPVRVLRASQACDAPARTTTSGGRSSGTGPLELASMTTVTRSPRPGRGFLQARVPLPRRLGQTAVLAIVDGGRRIVEQTVVGAIPACVRVPPAGPTVSALTS